MARRIRFPSQRACGAAPFVALACLAPAASGCGGEAAEAPFSVHDSAGVRIVTNHRAAALAPPRLGPLLFAVGDEATMPFGRVRDALLLPDGRLAVLDSRRRMVFLFDARGRVLDSLGGPGEGPGEFRRPSRLGATAGSDVRVYDGLAQRITTFPGAVGETPRTLPLEGGRPASDLAFAPDDLAVVARGSFREGIEARDGRPGRMPVPGEVALLDLRTGRETTFTTATLSEITVLSGTMISWSPFAHRLALGSAADHVVLGATDGFVLRRHDLAGQPFQEVRYPVLVRPVDEEELDSLRERHRRLAAEEDGIVLEGIFEPDAQPERRPAFGRMVVAPSGWIWIGNFVPNGGAPAEWLAFDPAGRLAGPVAIPEGLEPFSLGDTSVVLRRVDALGVESVEVRALEVPPVR